MIDNMIFASNVDDCLKLIKEEIDSKDRTINRLREENDRLKNEAYKDSELKAMQERLNESLEDYYRGFPISKKEEAAINEWKHKHDVEVHGLDTDEKRFRAGGTIGGRYSYCFVPTSIGVLGIVKCHCGAEFTFQNI